MSWDFSVTVVAAVQEADDDNDDAHVERLA